MDPKTINTTALAYIGDAVYEIYARERVLIKQPQNVDVLHRNAIMLVCASGQALAIKRLMREEPDENTDFSLTHEERVLVRRARNRKITSKAKNADPITYKWATAFEALVGYLHLNGEKQRLDALVEETFKIIEEKGKK